jgi:hypothetical protein
MPTQLILGNDIRKGKMKPWVKNIIGNPDIIAINQDSRGEQAVLANQTKKGDLTPDGGCGTASCTFTQVFTRSLSGKTADFAVMLLNRAGFKKGAEHFFHNENIRIDFKSLRIPPGQKVTVTDVWSKQSGVYSDYFEAKNVAPRDQVTITIKVNK